MMRNDYRRALILLRGRMQGYSGHVRLERRTLMGSMYFMIQAPDDGRRLQAVLAGRYRDDYYACQLGEICRDGRGQGTLGYSFDPRSICGRELEQYQLVMITDQDGGSEILLCGNINGHAELDWERVRAAVCTLSAQKPETESLQPDESGYTAVAEESDAARQELPEETRESENEQAEAPEEVLQETYPVQSVTETQTPESAAPDKTAAGDLLDLDMDIPWPEPVEVLRQLFAWSPPLENAPDDEYIYIAAAMPEESGYPYVAVGLIAQNGAPVRVRYALPAVWSAVPPAGLEDYSWVGGANRGWWVTQAEIYPDGML